ncbi:MAG TPA: amidohydrolase family protein [Caulobacterales bacterium]|nr:amidohydrolase family protein [Caulobacterales bacterium]
MPGTRIRLYDSHAHLVSDDLVRYPRNPMTLGQTADGASTRPPGTIGQPGGMHGPNPVNEKPTAEQMHRWMAEENVVGIAAVQKGMIYRFDNSYIVDAADIFPDEMRAVIIVDPLAPETAQVVRDLAKRGIVGVRYFPVNVKDKIAWFGSPGVLEIAKLTCELGLVLDFEAPMSNSHLLIPYVENIADKFPSMSIVLDHVFMPDVTLPQFGIDQRFDGFAKRKNISVKFTSLSMDVIREKGFAPEAVLRRTVDFYGADRVMWGSDIGTSSGTYKEMVQRAHAATVLLNDDERRQVLHDTGRRIFTGWKGD